MTLTRQDMDRIIDEHFRYEANDDVEGVLATLADHDLLHDIVGWPDGPSRDKDGARAFYQTLFADLDEGTIRTEKVWLDMAAIFRQLS